MTNGDEVVSPTTDDPTPLPKHGWDSRRAARTASVRIDRHAAGSRVPFRHAADSNLDRDGLDETLNQLRITGVIRVATWERGFGQGYVLTPEGETALATGLAMPAPTESSSGPNNTESIIDDPLPIEDRPTTSLEAETRPLLVVPVLLAANLLWFFVGLVMVFRAGLPVEQYPTDGNPEVLHRIGAVNGYDLIQGEWWRLASSCFVHIGGAHLLMNLFALVMVGPLAELLWGRGRLLAIYLFSGLAGTCLAMAMNPDTLLAGASGAIWGLLMSLVAWFMLFKRYLPREVVAESTRRLTVVIVLSAMFSFVPGISWQGHLGGAMAGFATAWYMNEIRFGDRHRRNVSLALLTVLVVGSIGGLIFAMRWSEPWAVCRQRAIDDKARAASEQFDRDVLPLVTKLTPDFVKPVELSASYQLIRPGNRRNAARVAELRARLSELKATADSVVSHLQVSPLGHEAFDRHRERTRAFAEARSRSFAHMLEMLDSPTVPDDAKGAMDPRRQAQTRCGSSSREVNGFIARFGATEESLNAFIDERHSATADRQLIRVVPDNDHTPTLLLVPFRPKFPRRGRADANTGRVLSPAARSLRSTVGRSRAFGRATRRGPGSAPSRSQYRVRPARSESTRSRMSPTPNTTAACRGKPR